MNNNHQLRGRRHLTVLLIAAGLAGCVTAKPLATFSPRKLADLRRGLTTRSEVLTMFGKPQRTSTDLYGGVRYTYFQRQLDEGSNPLLRLPGMRRLIARDERRTYVEALIVTFREEVISDYTYQTNSLTGARLDDAWINHEEQRAAAAAFPYVEVR